MKKSVTMICGLICLLSMMCVGQVAADSDTEHVDEPKEHVQGNLKNALGANISDGNYTMNFAIYRDSTGGSQLWNETQTVNVKNGVFSVMLGTVSAIPKGIGWGPCGTKPCERSFLQTTVNGEVLSPRRRMGSVPTSVMSFGLRGDVMTSRGSIYGVDDSCYTPACSSRWNLGYVKDPNDTRRVVLRLFRPGDTIRPGVDLGTDSSGSRLTLRAPGVNPADTTPKIEFSVGSAPTGAFAEAGVNAAYYSPSMKMNDTSGETVMSVVGGNLYTQGTIQSGNSIIINGKTAPYTITSTSNALSLGDDTLKTTGRIETNQIKIPTGAVDGYVLTSDAFGVGGWRVLPGVGGCWLCAGPYTWLADTSDLVGIGVVTPVERLTVNGSERIYPGVNDPWGKSRKGLVIGSLGSDAFGRTATRDSGGIFLPSNASDYSMIYSRARLDGSTQLVLRVQDDPDDHILLQPSGNVGINTETPTAKLHVEGDLLATSKANIGLSNTNAGTNTLVVGTGSASTGNYSSVTGGEFNYTTGVYSHVGGGSANRGSGNYGTIGGGQANVDTAVYGGVFAGRLNRAGDSQHDSTAVVLGGESNSALAPYSTAGGGENNSATQSWSTVVGGNANDVLSIGGTIGGGSFNHCDTGSHTTVAGGYMNSSEWSYATAGGGYGDTAMGAYSTVPGGYLNKTFGQYSFAAGSSAKAMHNNTFVWSDGVGGDMSSTAANQFIVDAVGGVGIDTGAPNSRLHVNGPIATKFNSTHTPLFGYLLGSANSVLAVETPSPFATTVSLPTAVGIAGRQYTIKRVSSGTVTVDANGSQTIDGALTYSLTAQWKYVVVVSDGANWIIVGNN